MAGCDTMTGTACACYRHGFADFWLWNVCSAWSKYKAENPGCKEEDRDAREIFEYGKNKEGYWTMLEVVKQLERAIRIFEANYPGAQAVFYFDNSSNHGCFADDALSAKTMNAKSGGV